jgi:putative oxidoreductase
MLKKLWTTRPFALDTGLMILRVACGFFLARHGWGKFIHYSENAATFPDPLHVTPQVSALLTIFGELFCSAFLILGLFTRIVLVPLIFNMIIIVTVIHGKDPLGDKEHAFLFLFPFITLFLSGPGSISLDRMLKR